MQPSSCPPWQPEPTGPTRRTPLRTPGSYTTARDTIPGTRCRGPAADRGTGPGATRDRGCLPSSGRLGLVRAFPDSSVSVQGRIRRGCLSGVRWKRGRPGPVGFCNGGYWKPLSGPQAATGLLAPPDRVLPSPFLLVSEPGPAWIMPVAGTFMHRRHAARPDCMAPPRIARPRLWGEPGRIRGASQRMARRRMPSASSAGGPGKDIDCDRARAAAPVTAETLRQQAPFAPARIFTPPVGPCPRPYRMRPWSRR